MKQSRSVHIRESGQAIVIIAFIFVGLLAFTGIVVDLGRYLAAQVQLRRATDAAALAGSAQFRLSGSTATPALVYDKVNRAARAMLLAHNIPAATVDSGVVVSTTFNDTSMITSPPTKKVRVSVTTEMPLIFLSLIGWHSVSLSTEATGEAASVDVALLVDISDSMANDVCQGSDFPCQYQQCHDPASATCLPFRKVKDSALEFLGQLSPGYDRVTVIPFALEAGYCINQGDVWPDCGKSAYNSPNPVASPKPVYLQMPWTADKITSNMDDARTFITNLTMAIPRWALDANGVPIVPVPPCPGYNVTEGWDPRQCMNTNTGGGIKAGATELLKEFDPAFPVPNAGQNHPSKERLRVIILLSDGAVTASGLGAESYPNYGAPSGGSVPGYCPRSTWQAPPAPNPFCRAAWPGFTIATGRHISTSVGYDSLDYTLDWADFAMLEPPPNGTGNGIIVFGIGLGDKVVAETKGDPQVGEKLLRYLAAGGDDGKLSSDPCAGQPSGTSCGNYFFAPTGDQLLDIFRAIAGRIFTRINQ